MMKDSMETETVITCICYSEHWILGEDGIRCAHCGYKLLGLELCVRISIKETQKSMDLHRAEKLKEKETKKEIKRVK